IWITFLANETSTEDEAQLILMAVSYLTVSCIAVLASLARQAFFVLVTNSAGCFLAAFFMVSTDYWWAWTIINTLLSSLCVGTAGLLFFKHKARPSDSSAAE
ncbi:MAG: hypothetical protein ACO2Y9_08005, partial [Pseudohongiellaceae bacterium]